MKIHAKNSFSKKLAYSYIVVFLIPLLLSVSIYVTAASYIYQYSESKLENELSGNEKFVEDLLTRLTVAYNTFKSDSTIRTVIAGGSPTPSQYNTLRNQLSLTSHTSDGLFDDVFVYFDADDYVVGRLYGGDTITNYYEAASSEFLQPMDEWREMMRTFHTGNLIRTTNDILYLKSINDNAEQAAVTLGVQIPADLLARRNMNTNLYGETNLILFDEQNQVVFASNNNLSPSLHPDALLQTLPEHSPQIINRGGAHYIASHSTFHGFRYLILVKEDDVIAQLRLLFLLIFLVLLATFSIGALVIRRFVLEQIRPVQEILNLLDANTFEGDEFELIQQSISRHLHYIMQSRSFLTDSFITHLIRGDVHAALPLEFSYTQFQLILLRIENMGIYTPEEGDDEKSLRGLMHTAVTNIFDELLGSTGTIYHSVQGETIVFLLNSNMDIRTDDVEHAYSQIQDYLGVTGYVTLSNTCQNLDEIQTLWQEAIQQLDSAEMRGCLGLEQEQSPAPAATGGGYQKYVNLFTNAVVDGQSEQALDAVRGMIQLCAENRKNMNDVKFNLLTMMNDATVALDRRTQTDIKNTFYDTNIAYKMIEAKSSARLLEITDEFLTLVSDLPGVSDSQVSLEERVANYIRAHFDDSNLNLKILADKFYKTPSYLSQKFKAHFGVGILDYLANTRLDTAKQKLLETNWSIEQIYESCGYTNTVTFSRQFKSYTGITPGRFRQMHKLFPPES